MKICSVPRAGGCALVVQLSIDACLCVRVTATALSRLHCIPSSLWDGNESFLTALRPVTQRGGWRWVEEEEEEKEAALRHHQPPSCPFALSS